MAQEKCTNCGAGMGRLEQAFVYQQHVVCAQCYARLVRGRPVGNRHETALWLTAGAGAVLLAIVVTAAIVGRMATADAKRSTPSHSDASAATPAPAPATKRIDLLALPAEQNVSISGRWELTPEGLFCSRGGVYLFNYAPPDEYDLRMEFTRRTGNDGCGPILPLPSGGSVAWGAGGWGNHAECFEHFENGGWFVLTTHDRDAAITNGMRNTILVRVRKKLMTAFYNGEMVSELPSDTPNLSTGATQINGTPVFGVMIDDLSTAMIHKMIITEISGRGHKVQ